MSNPDSAAARGATKLPIENELKAGVREPMASVSEPYLREQLEKRREGLKSAIAAGEAPPLYLDMLREVDSALERMEHGTFGICEVCHESVEKERLIADPLVRVCLEDMTGEEKSALEQDLQLASSVQRSLLPATSVRHGDWEIHYEYKPLGAVSGDYCDLIVPSNGDGKLLFLLGDVSGKGVAASLLMTHLHAMFRSLAGVGLELDGMMEKANRVFNESTTAGQFATLICGQAGARGEVEIVSAGHYPALHLSHGSVKEVGSTGLPLGMFSSSRYTIRRVRLEPGDCLLLFTDGISEARSQEGREYGVAQLSRIAGELHGSVAREFLAGCLKDVRRHSSGARQADDQTLMVLHRSEPPAQALSD
jgi:phosphoserine phosphatase RsbU/P